MFILCNEIEVLILKSEIFDIHIMSKQDEKFTIQLVNLIGYFSLTLPVKYLIALDTGVLTSYIIIILKHLFSGPTTADTQRATPMLRLIIVTITPFF